MPHRPQLDTLRFIAFLAVFLFHADEDRFDAGQLGVPLFFVLSGFLITRVLVLHESGSLGRDLGLFYLRRTLRIFPLYYAVLLVLLFAGRLEDPAWYFLYLHNVYVFHFDTWTGETNHFWSLCVEEQFYLVYPLLLLFTPARLRFALLAVLLAGCVSTRLSLAAIYPGSRAWALLPVAGEYLVWGCLAGMLDLRLGEGRSGVRPYWWLVLGLCLHGVAVVDQFGPRHLAALNLQGVYPSAHGVGFALIVFGLWRLPQGPLMRLLTLPPVVYLGRISYGLYVYHNFCYGIKGSVVEVVPWLARVPGIVLVFGATVGLAVLSWHLFESPILRLKDRFRYKEA